MTLGDPVRVLPSEYQRAGQVGVVVAHHGVLTDYVFVRFGASKVRTELIEISCLQPMRSNNGTIDGWESER